MYSHSKIECFNFCQYKYYLQYVKKLSVLFDCEPANPLIVGSAMHLGIEKGLDKAIEFYKEQYPILSELHYDEITKLEYLIPKVDNIIRRDNVKFELELKTDEFIGYVDYIEYNPDGSVNLYDFKYSNKIDHYLNSPQVHLYKYYFELLNPSVKVAEIGYIFIPKIAIRQKKTENLTQFRKRLINDLSSSEVRKVVVNYDRTYVDNFKKNIEIVANATQFLKIENSNACRFCGFNTYCQDGYTYDLIEKQKKF